MEVLTQNNQVLPVEIWTEVFGYLSHTEKLISRLVCKEWNLQISTDLAKTSYFDMTTIERHEVLLGSDVPYTKVIVGDYCSSGFALPQKFRDHVTSLQLNISGLEDCMRAVVRFPLLNTLDLKIIEDKKDGMDSKNSGSNSDQKQNLESQFKVCLGRLKNISIKFPHQAYSALRAVLNGFDYLKTMSLTGLSIKEEPLSEDESDPIDGCSYNLKLLMPQIFDIINKSCRTLVSLGIDINSDPIQELVFSDLIPKLSELEHLKLETIKIYAEPSQLFEDRDFLALQNFLKMQVRMKKVTLPWSCKTSLSLSNEFLDSLPKDIVSMELLTKDHVTSDFYLKFPKLEHMSIVSFGESMFEFNTPYPGIRRLEFNFREDIHIIHDIPGHPGYEIFHRNLSNSLVNLAELSIVNYSDYDEYVFVGSDLQLVIQHLKQLRVLEVNNCKHVNDNGVTGIEKEYIDELTYTKRIYRCLEVPKERVEGLPLCSLKSLEKLVLLRTIVTDGGIYYGLQFGPKLKHLTLRTSTEMNERDLTEWGLYWLAKGNPGLEVFDVSLTNGRISKDGIEDVRRQLPLVESTRKFKVINDTD